VVAVVVAWLLALVRRGVPDLVFWSGTDRGLLLAVGPVLWASLRNGEYRKYKYSGFFRGRVLFYYRRINW